MEYNKTYNFGKIDYNRTGKKRNAVTLELTLKIEGDKRIFTASGNIWNNIQTDILCGGQCIDDIYKEYASQLQNPSLYKKIMELWEKWHLNDMHAGCIHQRKFESEPYKKHENAFCKKCGYTYGHAWKYQAIDKKDLISIMSLLDLDSMEIYRLTR